MNYKCPLCTGELRLDNHTRDYFTNCEWPKVCDTGPIDYEQSLFFLQSVEQNARHAMATRVTDGARRERHEKRETTRKARENGLSRSSDFLASKLKC